MNCDNKIKYPNKKEADIAAVHNSNTTKQDLQVAYKCNKHQCWHTGHPKDYSDNPVARIYQILDGNKSSKNRKNKGKIS
jgi:hypothetical protein